MRSAKVYDPTHRDANPYAVQVLITIHLQLM